MNQNQKCLTDDMILQIEEDRISRQALERIEAHVSTCDFCHNRFDIALRTPEWTEELRPVLLQSSEFASPFTECHSLQDDASLQADIIRMLGPTDDPHMLGRIGSYEIAGVIGRGGMGIVFKAFDATLDRFVAIKMLAPHLATSGAAKQRFVREGKAAAAVVDDYVMPVYAVDEWQGVPYLVMQYSRGCSLQQRLNEQGPLGLKEILRIGIHVARGLSAAHAQGLVHRDIKPSNILLSDTVERAMLMDFGLARAVDDASMTRTGTVAGTPQYMSPEQARAETIDQRSDLFSFGSVLYAMCAGRPPFRGDSAVAVLKMICDKEPRPITEINTDVPSWLCQIVDRLMSKSPEHRFTSADDVADLLEECLAHVQQPEATPLPTILAVDQGSAVSAQSHGRDYRATKWLATALLLPAIVALGVIIVLEFNKGTLTITSEADDVPIRVVQKSLNGPQSQKRSGTSPWSSKNVEDWLWNRFGGLTTVSINSSSISRTVQGWITEDQKHVVIPSHFIVEDDVLEFEVQTVDGRIHEASVVESWGHLSLLSVEELPFPGLRVSDTVTVRENEVLYIASRFNAIPVRVLHGSKTTGWSMFPQVRFVDAIVVDTIDLKDADLLHGAAVVKRSGKLVGMIMNVEGREKPVVPIRQIEALSNQLLNRANDTMVRAAIETMSPEDSTMQVVAEGGAWPLANGVTLRIESREDKLFGTVHRAVLTWKKTEGGRPALKYAVDIAADEHDKWAVAWEKGTSMIWLLAKGNYQSGSSIRSIDYSVPANVVTAVGYGDDRFDLRLPELTELQEARRNPYSIGSPWVRLPEPLDTKLVKHFGLGDPNFGISSLLPTGPHIPGGQYAESAILQNGWTFEGRVEDTNGKPLAGVHVYATSAWSRAVKLAKATTDDEGQYKLVVRPDLMTFAQLRRISVFAERQGVDLFLPSQANFHLRLSDAEEPQRLLESVRLELHQNRSRLPKSVSLPSEFAVEKFTAPVATPDQPDRADFKDAGLSGRGASS